MWGCSSNISGNGKELYDAVGFDSNPPPDTENNVKDALKADAPVDGLLQDAPQPDTLLDSFESANGEVCEEFCKVDQFIDTQQDTVQDIEANSFDAFEADASDAAVYDADNFVLPEFIMPPFDVPVPFDIPPKFDAPALPDIQKPDVQLLPPADMQSFSDAKPETEPETEPNIALDAITDAEKEIEPELETDTGTETEQDIIVAKDLGTDEISPPPPPDMDLDGVSDAEDNCPLKYNPDQADNDLDSIGDVCDKEECDEFDNNGNGIFNEGFDVGAECFVGIGACETKGVKICADLNSTKCNTSAGTPAVDDSVCNNIDDDCDSETDEDYDVNETECGVGECFAQGVKLCINGFEVDGCAEGKPNEEVCNGLDDDCDNETDENKYLNSDTLAINCYETASKTEILPIQDCWDSLTTFGTEPGAKTYISIESSYINGIETCFDEQWKGKPDDPPCPLGTKFPIGCASEIEFEISFFETQYIWKLYDGVAVLASLHFDQTKDPKVASIQVFLNDPKCNVLFNTVSCE